MNIPDRVKVLFVQSDDEGSLETESLWCDLRSDGGYVVDNIPFIAKNISLGDVIEIEYDDEARVYYFENLIDESGNTTVRLVVQDATQIQEIRQLIAGFGCESEAFLQRQLVAVNIPAAVDYSPVKSFLDSGEYDERWFYEESCLAHSY